ncbi:MAG: cytochrome c-type biogenesis protein CcmH, partial [Candidatus Sulfotelmatobacter sp.]
VGTAALGCRRAQPGCFDRSVNEGVLSRGSMTNANPQPKPNKRGRKAAHMLLLCLAVFTLLGAGDPATRFNEIGHQMMCICGCKQILLECNHVGCPASDGMRNELMAAVSRGDSDSLVEQSFVQKYGPTVLAAPTMKGFDRAAYIIPPVALILGFGLIVMVVRSWKNRPAPAIADGLEPARGAELEQFRDQARKETDL